MLPTLRLQATCFAVPANVILWDRPPSALGRLPEQAHAISLSCPHHAHGLGNLGFLSQNSLLIGHAACRARRQRSRGCCFCELASQCPLELPTWRYQSVTFSRSIWSRFHGGGSGCRRHGTWGLKPSNPAWDALQNTYDPPGKLRLVMLMWPWL